MRSLLIILTFFLAGSYHSQNNLSLVSTNGKTFRVTQKTKAFNETPQAHVLIENIRKDTFAIELELENKKKFPVTVYLLEKGIPCKNKEFSYRVESDGISLSLLFMGMTEVIALPSPLIPSRPVIDTSLKYKNKIFGHLFELKDGKPLYFNNIPKDGICKAPMPGEYLNYISFLASKAEVPDQKVTIVENSIRNNCLSVDQLNQLLNLVDFEIEKLKIVRMAYYHLSDPVNKNDLKKSFRFEASVNELKNFLGTADDQKVKVTGGCVTAASEMIVENFAQRLSTFSNDTERFDTFKKGYSALCYTAVQSAFILNKFVHDREKLDAAKLLYLNCVEKEKFQGVDEVFSYNQTKSDLKEFIDKQNQ